MFDYHQRPATEEYRENWERIYGAKPEQPRQFQRADFDVCGVPVYIDPTLPPGYIDFVTRGSGIEKLERCKAICKS